MSKRLQHRYVQIVGVTVIVLALVRCVFPKVAGNLSATADDKGAQDTLQVDSLERQHLTVNERLTAEEPENTADEHLTADEPFEKQPSTRYVAKGEKYHRIISVPSYAKAFPDSNQVQLVAAQRWGVPPVKNREDAERRKDELVYVGFSPYYDVAKLDASIPYLVPRAAILLEDIARNFMDSLQVKGIPMRRFVVSSVLRTEEDVARLRRSNHNATEHSCHLYGTTFDINYNIFHVMFDPDKPVTEEVWETRLKQILSEVLDDLRQQGRCYIKYEVKQPCFHITVR